jgi:hypothetical protein
MTMPQFSAARDRHRGTRSRRSGRFLAQTGQSIIEAAFVLPVLLLAVFAIIEFSWLLFADLSLQNGVAEAARYGITGQAQAGLTREESIRAILRDSTPTLTIEDEDFQFSHLVGGNWVNGVGGPGEIEKLTVTYTHDVLVLTPLFAGGEVTLRAESAMKNEDRFN